MQAAHNGKLSGAVLLDLSAAFDLVSHDILIDKLKVYGLQNDILEWVQSYLTKRVQSVWIDHTFSSYLPCEVGVPQGSNLGPLFFSLFVNDLPFSLDCEMVQYADDSTLTASGKCVDEISDKLQSNCESVKLWMEKNKQKLNPEKTHIILLGTDQRLNISQDKLQVQIGGVKLKSSEVQYESLLGCWIQSNLKWGKHITELALKLKSRIVAIRYLKYVLPFQQRKILAEGIVNSVLTYCLPLYGGCTRGEIKELQIIQNMAARIVCHAPRLASRSEMFNYLDWLTVTQMIRYFTLIAVYRIQKTKEPEYFSGTFSNLNHRGKIIIQNTRLSLAKNSFRIRGGVDWNLLPSSVKNEANVSSFKKSLRKWVKENTPQFLD